MINEKMGVIVLILECRNAGGDLALDAASPATLLLMSRLLLARPRSTAGSAQYL